ncbi:hypothetical protein LguiA_013867 [Lonicera macranthoides]
MLHFGFGRLHKSEIAKEMTRKAKDALLRLFGWYDDNKPNSVSSQSENEPSRVGLVDETEEKGLDFLTSQFNKHMESEDDLGAKSEVERFLPESREVEDKDNNFNLLGW